jgi:hypothetical protein
VVGVIWDYGYIARPRELPTCPKRDRNHGSWTGQRQWGHFPKTLERFQMALELSSDDRPSVTLRFPEYEYLDIERGLSFEDGMALDANTIFTDVSMWHQDYPRWTHIACWSTNGSTEALAPDGTIYTPKPKHLVVLDNKACFHRTGRNVKMETRIFLRVGIGDSGNNSFEPLDKYRVA